MTSLEISANAITAISIVLAGRNSVHTWWTGMIGCVLFGALFYNNQLFADVVLQAFFFATSVYGYWIWKRNPDRDERPITSSGVKVFGLCLAGAVIVTSVYGYILYRYTNAYAPFWDSAILAFSVVAQFLLMNRKIETWPFWMVVNTIAVPLYFGRGLHLTSGLYALYWGHAVIAFLYWRGLLKLRTFTP
jgi:nicotinamide mononucleotide transporter